MNIPPDPGLNYVGVALLFAGLFLILAGSGILKVEKITVATGTKTWGLGAVLFIFGMLLLLPEVREIFQVTPVPSVTPEVSA